MLHNLCAFESILEFFLPRNEVDVSHFLYIKRANVFHNLVEALGTSISP